MNQDTFNQLSDPPLPNSPQASSKKPFHKRAWFIVLASILGLVFIVWPLVIFAMSTFSGGGSKEGAAAFYEMLETAGQKTKVHFLYETSQEAQGEQSTIYVRSLAEFDVQSKTYSTVNLVDTRYARSERCVNGKEYSSEVRNTTKREEAEEAIRAKWSPSQDRFAIGTCDYSRIRYQGSITDGLLPVGLSEAQVKGMIDGLEKRDDIAFKDEGQIEYDGKKARKISFELSKEKSGSSNADAGAFFYAFRDGASAKTGSNFGDLSSAAIRAHFENRFHQTSPTPELKGFYLIDEQTKLPLFSEIATFGEGVAAATYTNVYTFPDSLTINETTPLPLLPRP